ncbi:putative methyltransferase (TIGR04325 family) [Variovorax boronicumulans]|uniref:TIGR04325 family methyltransferase n=1 Tax=Variovorax boronicumulans TaxID=436515 RepID=UPI002473B9BE|nr:TIGR04325 family methyltransferase [Variovorax boronicumulans]MDH6166232.1 putative methyltransferase (TIGR04325 family) [Variovorax boronicumulans]
MLSNLLPPASPETAYRQKFLDNQDENLFMGSFESFTAAEADAPPSKAVGYDHAAAANLYSPQIYFYDYPGLFWLGRSIDAGLTRVFDLGGHIGIKYYAFRRVLSYPDSLRWTVCDVPSVIESGRAVAVQREVTGQLGFTTDYRDASGCDVLYASGSLQYLPVRIDEMLSTLQAKPKRIVLNTTAVHPERTIYTLNSIGVAVCPYRIEHHDDLLAMLARSGYRKRDTWRNEGKPIEVPFVDGGDKAYYAGGCFDLV